MKNFPTRLLRQSGLYALGNVALKASGLLLALLYLNPRYLSAEAFGYYGLLIVTAQFGYFVTGLGLSSGLLKFMTDEAYAESQEALPFTALAVSAISAAVGFGLLWLLAPPLAAFLLDDAGRAGLIRLVAFLVAFRVVMAVPLMLLRIRERAGLFALSSLSEMVLLLGAAYVLVVQQGRGLDGLMLAHVFAAGVVTLLMTGLMLGRTYWVFLPRLARPLIRFGAPLVMASLAAWFLNAGDRYLLKWLKDAESVGLYEWAARLGSVLNLLLVQSFQQAFAVLGLKALAHEGDEAALHRATFRHYVVWGGWAALGLSLLAYDVTRLLPADPFYLQADDLVLFLALGFLANGLYYVLVNIIYGAGRSRVIGLNVVAVAVLNAVLNLALIPTMGVLGAAVATLVSYFALAGGAAYFARQETTTRFPWHLVLAVVLLVMGLYALGRPGIEWPTALRLATRAALLLAYPALLFAAGLYRKDDFGRLLGGLRSVLRR